jgi:hypothetical protein
MRSHTGSATKPRSRWKPWVYEPPRTMVVSEMAIYRQLLHSFRIADQPDRTGKSSPCAPIPHFVSSIWLSVQYPREIDRLSVHDQRNPLVRRRSLQQHAQDRSRGKFPLHPTIQPWPVASFRQQAPRRDRLRWHSAFVEQHQQARPSEA